MEYEDLLTIETPEGVPIDLHLAGYGSRFISALVDGILKLLVIGAAALVLGQTAGFGGVATAVFLVLVLLVTVGYDIAFEVLANGRTPGKRGSGLRVTRDDGRPVTFIPSAVRNLIRLIDGPGTGYAVGTIAILVTKRNQRLGDLAAGTIVVRERSESGQPTDTRFRRMRRAGGDDLPDPAGRWDLGDVGAEELGAVRSFLERRGDLDPQARNALALQLADGLRPRVPGAESELSPESFLEQLAEAKARRG